ncbi:FHA domain-containing protein [Nonomuraea sp. NPDC050404]|uniref:FHA domain-containing protein n=1 Tax=Nonomuraea sp. NPDC050404 TaxID=3155783 RepID=UPI0033E995EE
MTRKVDLLPREFGSLAHGLPPAPIGTLFLMGPNGGMRVAPDAGFELLFGRGEPDVHVCVGEDDPHVSRRHGRIAREGSGWMLHNTGRLAIRFPESRLVLGGQSTELPLAYTPLFIVGPRRQHLLEVGIATGATRGGSARPEDETTEPTWDLNPVERLVLVCLSQRYLRDEPRPQPLTWAQVAQEMQRLRPSERWTQKRVAHIVAKVRNELSAKVPGLREEEIPPPLGNTLNHNLITELLVTTTLQAGDLGLLGDGSEPRSRGRLPRIRP